MTNKKFKGFVYMILASLIYGFTPILAKLAFEDGADSITIVFLRGAISLPFIAIIMKVGKIPFKIPKTLVLPLLLCGVVGYSLTSIFLYVSYSFIDVGLAVALHYINPVLVTLACALIFREKMSKNKWVALILCVLGVMCLLEATHSVNIQGIIFGLLSGVCCAFYIISLDRSKLESLHYLTVTFYLVVIQSIVSFSFGALSGRLSFDLTQAAWIYAVIIAILVSICAVSLFQRGVMYAGPPTASMLSTLEPISVIAFGAIFLAEPMTISKIAGGALIILSVIALRPRSDKDSKS